MEGLGLRAVGRDSTSGFFGVFGVSGFGLLRLGSKP